MTCHPFWVNAGARNVRETTATTGRCRFMRTWRAPIDNIDLIVCAVLIGLVVLYEVTP